MKYKNAQILTEKMFRMQDGSKSQIGGRLIQAFKKQVEKLDRNKEWVIFCKTKANKMILDYVTAAARKAWKKDYYDGSITGIQYTGAKTGTWVKNTTGAYSSSESMDFYLLHHDFVINVEAADDVDANQLVRHMKGAASNTAIGRKDVIAGSIEYIRNAVEIRDSFLLGSD